MTSSPARHSSKIALLLPLLLLIGCQEKRVSSLPTVTMQLGSKTFTLEVAKTIPSRETGLMRRDSMPVDRGMIFVFARAEPLGFYMRNTRIPLDIVYVDADGKVISIKQMKPYDESTTPSDGPAKWAIELNEGVAAQAGIKVGDKLQIPQSASSADQ
jgi:uncharacterized membrane protein (UPF0127 family)